MSNRGSIRDLLGTAEQHLVKHGVPNARRNAEWMLCHTLGCSMLDLYVRSRTLIDDVHVRTYWESIERRARREPLQYILGSTEFMSLPFDVRPGVFVPRPETEILVEHAEQLLRSYPLHRSLTVLDMCCGAGIIGVSLAHRIANLGVTAIDLSGHAVALTGHNADKNDVAPRIQLCEGEALTFLRLILVKYTAILCNPPYIATSELAALPREVREHEPREALDGGPDGLEFYRRAIPLIGPRLADDGFVMFEIGDTQGEAVAGMLRDAGFAHVYVTPDLSGRDRVVTGRRERAHG
jgi:release factor glutamine methyltransferase